MQRTIKITLLSLLLLKLYSYADSNIDDLLLSLNNDLNKYEKIATSTKQNEHYQPYIISTLEGETLEKLGISSLEEALKLIPGVDIASDNLNFKSPIFRGSNPTSFGQSNLLIDGVLVNNIFTSGYGEYLTMPIEMIKRIEVIRGPGSQSNGINAYAGSINVITYAEGSGKDLIFAKIGSNSYRSGGFQKGYQDGKFSFFSDLYYQEDDRSEYAGLNGLATGILDIKTPWYTLENNRFASAGNAPLWFKNYSFGLNMSYGDYSIKGRINKTDQGGAYGINYVQSEYDDVIGLPNNYIEFAFDKTLENLQIISKIGFKRDAVLLDFMGLPAGSELPKFSNPKEYLAYPIGAHLDLYTKQLTLYHSTFLNYINIVNHEITIGYYLSQIKTDDMLSKAIDRDTGIGWVDYTDIYPFFDKEAARDTYTFSLQDKYQYSDALQFLYSLNYEKNSHIDGSLNPRISLIYQKRNDDIYKFSFSSSHRTPSWQELYTINNHARVGNKDMKPEKVEAYEGAYIKHFSNDSYIQANLYYLINKDQIHNRAVAK